MIDATYGDSLAGSVGREPPKGRPQAGWGYADVLGNIDIGIMVLDTVRQVVDYRNPAATDILRDAGRLDDFTDLSKHLCGGSDIGTFAELAHTSRTFQCGHRLLRCTIYPVSATHYCLFLRDVTEKNRLESIAQAVNTMDNIGFIFSGIRHEIGNPLNSIKMTISVLRKNLDRFSKETISEYIERTASEVARIEYLLKALRNFSMFEKLDIKEHDLGVFLAKLADLVSHDFEKQGITLIINPLTEALQALIDPRALHQALLNLLSNAADALEERPRPQVRISARRSDGLIWLTVEDNGCGIAPEQQKLLFQPFCTNKAEGNGLGLVITQKLLAKMNASLEIRSTEQVGTAVHIAIPLAPTEPPPSGFGEAGHLQQESRR